MVCLCGKEAPLSQQPERAGDESALHELYHTQQSPSFSTGSVMHLDPEARASLIALLGPSSPLPRQET